MNDQQHSSLKKSRWGQVKRLNLAVLVLVVVLMASLTSPALAMTATRAQPQLLQLAASAPDQTVAVIVQKHTSDTQAEDLVTALGGVVVKNLYIINAFTAQLKARDVPQLAMASSVRWVSLDAPMVGMSVGSDTVRDEFNAVAFDNNNGTLTWSGPWQENDPHTDGAGPAAGLIQIADGALRLNRSWSLSGSPSAARHVNLTGTTNATLSFDYHTSSGVDPEDAVKLEVSGDGGASYSVLETFAGINGDSAGSRSYDLTGYISADTVIRFRISNLYAGSNEYFYADNVQIALTGSNLSSATLRDEFNTAAFGNNDGTAAWSGDWVETDPEADGAGAAAGQVQVVDGSLQLDDSPDTGAMPSAARHANLSGAVSAVFTFDFHTDWGVDPNDFVAVEASSNGGASFSVLETIGGFSGAIAGARSYDISNFISADTVIRFRVAEMYGQPDEHFYADNVQIQYSLSTLAVQTSSVMDIQETQVRSGDLVNVSMTLSASQNIAGVTPSALAVQGTNGVGATLVSGPTPAGATVGAAGTTFTWVYRATSTGASGTLTFGGTASGSGTTWSWAHTDSIGVDPPPQGPIAPPTDPGFATWASGFGSAYGADNAVDADFNSTPIAAGSTIWFNAVVKPSGLGQAPVKIRFFETRLSFTANGRLYEIDVPEGTVLYSPTAKAATTTFDTTTGTWLTTVPSSYTSEAFVAGVAFPVTTALPGSIKDVTWTGHFTTDTPGVTAKWSWGAAVYASFKSSYAALGVKPINDDKLNPYVNKDKAGTPENARPYLVKGARSDGGSNYTGSWSGADANPTFNTRDAIVDSPTGPDGVFASGSVVSESVTGFVPEVSPGYAIRKVEAVLQAYVPAPLSHDFKLKLFIGGSSKDITVDREIFNGHIGALNAGPVYVDLTNARSWQWADFDNGLELVIDQTALSVTDMVYYDAIGIKVTSMPGADTTGGSKPSSLPSTVVDINRLMGVYQRTVRATDVWNEGPGFLQGQGVTVAVIDSGVYKSKDLKNGRILANVNFSPGYHNGADAYGHGTFVATTIAGDGSASKGQYMGIAPKTNILNVRVSDDQGASTEADVIEALQWVFEHKGEYNIRVVNMSLNSSVAESYLTSPLNAAVEFLWFSGVVVVTSAGNNGTADLYAPANDPFVITVGATDDKGTVSLADDVVASFSAYGSLESGGNKPDLVAPGRNIIAYLPNNNGLRISQEHKSHRIDRDYFSMSGTSMSAPIVSGAVAMLLQDEPNLTPDQVKYRLMATANKSWPGYDPERAGAGYLDIYRAVHGTTTAAANQRIMPNLVLARMAMMAYWASNNGSGVVDWGSVNWNSVNWNSVNWNSVNWNSVNWNSVNWNSVNWNSLNWNSLNWSSDFWDD